MPDRDEGALNERSSADMTTTNRCQSSSTLWYHGLGSPVSPVDGREYVPSSAMAHASTTIWGRLLSNQTSQRLQRGEPIEIHVLGGSVSLGSYVVNEVFGKRLKHSPHPDNTLIGTGLQAGNFNSRAAWPALLEAALNGCLGGGAVHVVNHAERAAGTDAWVDRLAAGSVNLSRADVVLIEEASNDAEGYAAVAAGGARGSFGGEPTAAGFTEVLLHQLRRLPRQPYCLWLTAAWRDFEYARARRAEGEHLWILRQYQVPHLSVLSAFAPYEGSQPVARFLRSVYFADCCHPTRTGHKIVAD